VHYLRLSGARAFGQSAHGLAARWFERSLEAIKHLPPSRDRTEQALDLHLDLRYALSPLGEFRRILECLGEAEKLAQELADQRRLARITSYLSNHFQVIGELDRAVEYGERALRMAAQEDDLATQVVARSYLSLAYQTLGLYPRATVLARENLEILGRAGEREWFGMALLPAVYSRTALVRALAETGEFKDGLTIAGEAVALSEEVQHPYSLMFALLGLGVVQLRRGRVEAALPALERSFELCRGGGSPTMIALVGSFLGSACAHTGDLLGAIRVLDEADRQAAVIGLAENTLPCALGLSTRSEIQRKGGNLEQAVQSAERSRAAFRQMGAQGYEAWAQWLIASTRAGLDRANRAASVEHEFREALAHAEALGMRPLIARCRFGLGQLLERAGRQGDAQSLLTLANNEDGRGLY
jgi:tetratricopeptide (TPR) repeat protein